MMQVRDDGSRLDTVMLPQMDAAYALARYLTRNPIAAEDIVQESYLRACRGFAGWRGESPKAWLLAIVRRCFLDTIAGAVPREDDGHALLAEAVTDEDPEALAATRHTGAMVRNAVETLPRLYREAIVLREFEALSYREIAAVVGAPVGTVMSRLSRARQMLADRLAPLAREDALLLEA